MPKETQSFLLSDSAMKAARYSTYENFQPQLSIGPTELQAWKQRIIRFQTQLRAAPTMQQGDLFGTLDSEPSAVLDPFSLRRQNTEFWRWQFDDVGVAAMYFVIDYAMPELPLLLYVGETVKSNQRWKGVHDCKRYLTNYRQSHYENGLESELAIAFWPHASEDRKARQKLESQLIYKWRSPFNKENWRYWNTPFVGGKEPSQ